MHYYQRLMTPCGELTVRASDKGLTSVAFDDTSETPARPSGLTDEACSQLSDYFARRRTRFSLPLDAGGTPFQQQVWAALTTIGYGTTVSYGAVAQQLSNANAVRAVGMANSKNPIAIIVPCHRVIGANGTLTGYAGGLSRKAFLLRHEGVDI
ncbi:methylated-DNA--[protein]-cysteine S-methyltransferase [Alteromonas halophila]|uniref:Methylated-DNA--protein-cysteine methyltransferase n=1 Tax=Alteromonas halophila TaxID=516698 RepID=A0A918JNE9_9ALTE|nr:methylated-DNA--[protein]-cysteine S-methyltransferase [Alteromonas halophila]GGW90401.1 methylated-DNA--protein-cysteine methyltransferase [Alteromonas halophila]